MTLNLKKIIAREFLILTIVSFLVILCFISTYLYNYYHQTQIEKIVEKISERRTFYASLSSTFDNKINQQKWLSSVLLEEYGESNNAEYTKESIETIWKTLSELAQSDSIKYRWEYTWNDSLTPFFKK